MREYALEDISLVLEYDTPAPPSGLEALLHDLSFVKKAFPGCRPSLRLAVRTGAGAAAIPTDFREVFHKDGFRGFEGDRDFVLTDGSSVLRLRLEQGTAEVQMAPAFTAKPALLQRNFWSFALMKLLRAYKIFSLHAAALAQSPASGLLIVAKPGSGKSTLAIGLIRRGWKYLSDDAVLLRRQGEGPEIRAVALRKSFYVDDNDAKLRYADLPVGETVPDTAGGLRRKLDIENVFPGQHLSACEPRTLIFPQIDSRPTSILEAMDATCATRLLLEESGPQLFDRENMSAHLDVLGVLVRQCRSYRLRAGSDLHANPGGVESLLRLSAT